MKMLVLLAVLAIPALAQSLPRAARPEDVGISTPGLLRLRERLKSDVDNNRIPGAVLLIARNGKVAAQEVAGFRDKKAQAVMKADAIFRIASMTKPIVSVAAMMLAEEGRLDIGAPVAQWLPEFENVRVGVEQAAPKRPMTVHDLLRHTSGLTYGFFGDSAVDKLYLESGMFTKKSLAQMVQAAAKLPLLHQPGEFWEYGISTDVLGRVVEVASGMDLDRFIEQRITKPLQMTDTAFYLSKAQAKRLAVMENPPATGGADPTVRPDILSGGGGLFSSAGDYLRFSQMLLNGGELEGVRILSPHTVALMTSDQLPPPVERRTAVAGVLGAFGPTQEMGTSFGLGFAVRTSAGRNPVPGSVGDYGWSGIMGTYFWVDPKEKLVCVLMVQIPQAAIVPYWRQTRTLVYQAVYPTGAQR
jgi:CubicO group peptidase (beta-lactamase class C family)